MKENYYIYTEIVNCGKIGKIALDSFHKYHKHKVHVYGTRADFEWIQPNDNNIFIEVDESILEGYKNGHIGTALLWEQVIKNCNSKYMIHFDSDTIFRENIIDDIIEKSKNYDIIGPTRNYHHNPQNIKNVMHLTDLCQTNCTLFNLEKITSGKLSLFDLSIKQVFKIFKYVIKKILGKIKMSAFAQKIHGSYSLYPLKTLDFFDQVMFDMISNGAKVYHLDFNEVGGLNQYGSRDNHYKDINNFPTNYKLDFGSKLVHFSCVGSGMNFYLHPERQNGIGKDYVNASLDRYALFCKIFYNEDLKIIDLDKYKKIIEIKDWY